MQPHMLDKLLAKVGGKYKLVSLYQKRIRELVRGLPPLVETDGLDNWQIVSREILEGKVELITGEEGDRMRREQAARESEELAALESKKGAHAGSEDKKKS